MKKILYIHHGETWGGASRCLRDLVAARPADCRAVVLTSGLGLRSVYEGVGAQVLATRWLGVVRLGVGWCRLRDVHRWLPDVVMSVPTVAETLRVIKEVQPDIVHLNSIGLAPSAIASRWAGVPVVWHIREPLLIGNFGFRKALARRVIAACADSVVAISEYDGGLVALSNGQRARVAYDWVDESEMVPARSAQSVREELGVDGNAPLVVYLGGGSRIKGAEVLLDAIAQIREQRPDCRFVVAGCQAPSRSGLRGRVRTRFPSISSSFDMADAVARSAEVSAVARTLGIVEDTTSLINASDLLVFPSTVPHFGRPIVEAAVLGKPAIASDFGETREIIADGVTGFLVRPGSSRQLAEKILEAITDMNRCRSMGVAAQERLREKCARPRNRSVILKIYEELLGTA